MRLKALLAAAVVAAVIIGLALPIGHKADVVQAESQIPTVDIG